METNNSILILVVLFLTIYLIYKMFSIKVYRFYSPTCPWCVKSQHEWDRFKSKCWYRFIKPVDINLNEHGENLAEKYGVKSVPTVLAIDTTGAVHKYEGDRSSESYLRWVNKL